MIHHPVSMRRAGRILSIALITAGAVILIDAGLTLAWKEPVSSIYGAVNQSAAASQLDELEERLRTEVDSGSVTVEEGSSEEQQASDLARQYARLAEDGRGIGRVIVPSLGAEYVFLEGTETGTLQRGPGRYPATSLPGQGRTVAIAGHRTTYSAPFRKINDLEDGEEIVVEMPYGTFTYEVEDSEVVEPTDVEVVADVGTERLVLTACHPLFSASERFVVTAGLAEVELNEELLNAPAEADR